MAKARADRVTSTAFVFKGQDGLRYIGLITSNAYVDRDGEIVAEDALKAWVNSVWKGGAYRAKNPLLFWHAGQPIGDVIWSDMRGAFLIEIAKERRTRFARLIFNLIERGTIKWGVSHGFRDKAHDFDGRWKVYRRIAKKETSILPLAFAANPFTTVKVKNMNLRLSFLRRAAPEAAALEERLTNDAKARQRKLERAGVQRKQRKSAALNLTKKRDEKSSRNRKKDEIEEKAIDPTSLAENLTSLLDGVFADAGVEAPADLNERIMALIESLDAEDAPVDVETVAEVVADTADELLAEEGAEAPDDLQEQITEVIEDEEAVEEEVASRKARTQRRVEKRNQQQTALLEELLDDMSMIGEIGESVNELSKAVKGLGGIVKEITQVKTELRQIKRKMQGGPRAASEDDDTILDDGDDDEDDADGGDDAEEKDRRKFKEQMKRRKQKTRSDGMFGDLYENNEDE